MNDSLSIMRSATELDGVKSHAERYGTVLRATHAGTVLGTASCTLPSALPLRS